MNKEKLKKLGFTNLDTGIENIFYKDKNVFDYEYFGQNKRPANSITLSKIKKAEKEKYIFLGLCCDSYGNKGFLFQDNTHLLSKVINF